MKRHRAREKESEMDFADAQIVGGLTFEKSRRLSPVRIVRFRAPPRLIDFIRHENSVVRSLVISYAYGTFFLQFFSRYIHRVYRRCSPNFEAESELRQFYMVKGW